MNMWSFIECDRVKFNEYVRDTLIHCADIIDASRKHSLDFVRSRSLRSHHINHLLYELLIAALTMLIVISETASYDIISMCALGLPCKVHGEF